ncbi:MAG: MBL fold metallo-hydrolase [Cytophagales bacterium]|nr:MBL fold metallo-hydrolase [Cytophagales bacterium]MDW8383781.1 MBL fold metallo-hydrolase [Flammeovirgaceae bacterium]
MKLTFWGAAQQVTGSMYLLEIEDYQILVDCGYDLENPSETNPVYQGSAFPFDVSLVDVVVLTHAHLDHSGRIPNLFREGFEGQILCTTPTMQLTELLLMDAASINQHKLKAIHKRKSQGHRRKQHQNDQHQLSTLYLEKHVSEALSQFVPIAFNKPFAIHKNISITFIPTGHLLGAANVFIEWKTQGSKKSILFSGDVGRKNYPLLPDPQIPPQADYVVCETTYGNRMHLSREQATDELAQIIEDCCVNTPGKLIIPSFSLGRTQSLIYTLHQLAENKRLPRIKIFADSPLAFEGNKIYKKNLSYLSKEAQEFTKKHGDLLDFENLHYVTSSKESKEVSSYQEPCIIISSSGMLEGGRIQEHIARNISHPYCTILMVGYCAEGTLGWKLLHARDSIIWNDKNLPIRAKIMQTDVLSGHGDQNDLIEFIHHQNSSRLQKIFLSHGEKQSMYDFKQTLHTIGYTNVEIPTKGESYLL